MFYWLNILILEFKKKISSIDQIYDILHISSIFFQLLSSLVSVNVTHTLLKLPRWFFIFNGFYTN